MTTFAPVPGRLPPFSTQVLSAVYSILHTQVKESRELLVACAGREECAPQYLVDRPGYQCWGLEFVIQGEGTLRLGDRDALLLPGQIFCYGPGIAHRIQSSPERPLTKYFVDFFGPPPAAETIRPGECRRVLEIGPMTQLFEELIREGNKLSPQRDALCAAYLRVILLKSAESLGSEEGVSSQGLAHLVRSRNYIDAHFSSLGSLHELADALHLDKSYLCRLFREFKQPSPHRYLTLRKLHRAGELLVSTQLPLKAIAAEVGYGDPLHFSRLFRTHFGIAPSTFRHARNRTR